MPSKPPPERKTTDPEQLKRFKEMAREVEVDERLEAFDRAFNRVMGRPQKTPTQATPGRNRSRRTPGAEGSR